MVNQGGVEMEYEEGQILTETEPARYVLSDVKYDKHRQKIDRSPKILGEGKIENVAQIESIVEEVMSYKYDFVQYWGSRELGLAKALDTTIKDGNETFKFQWGIKSTEATVRVSNLSLCIHLPACPFHVHSISDVHISRFL